MLPLRPVGYSSKRVIPGAKAARTVGPTKKPAAQANKYARPTNTALTLGYGSSVRAKGSQVSETPSGTSGVSSSAPSATDSKKYPYAHKWFKDEELYTPTFKVRDDSSGKTYLHFYCHERFYSTASAAQTVAEKFLEDYCNDDESFDRDRLNVSNSAVRVGGRRLRSMDVDDD